jgi:hypothetical protein
MTTLAAAILSCAKALGDVIGGTATGGSGTTLVDTGHSEPADYLTGGTIWFLTGNNAGKSAVITTWDPATHTFTFLTPGAACAAGNLYAACGPDYPRYLLVQSVADAYGVLGGQPATGPEIGADRLVFDAPVAAHSNGAGRLRDRNAGGSDAHHARADRDTPEDNAAKGQSP